MQTVSVKRETQVEAPRRRSPLPRDWTGVVVYLYGTVCALLVSIFVYHSLHAGDATIDLNGFGLMSRNIALGRGLTWGNGPTMRRGPLYPIVAGAILKVFGNYQPGIPDAITYRPVLIAQCFLFGLTVLTAWAVAKRLFGPRVALVTAALAPLFPESLRFIAMTEVETLSGFFAVLLAYLGLRFLERPNLWSGALFGLAAAADTLTKAVIEFYVIVFLVLIWGFWILRAPGGRQVLRRMGSAITRRRVGATVAALVVFALALTPWLIRNWVVSGGQYIGIATNGPGEILKGYTNAQPQYYMLLQDYGGDPGVWGWDPVSSNYENNLLRPYNVTNYGYNYFHAGTVTVTPPFPPGVTAVQFEAQKDRVETQIVRDRLLHDPLGYIAGQFVPQLAMFWYMIELRVTSLIFAIISAVLLILAVMGIILARRTGGVAWPVYAVILYLNVAYAASVSVARFSMPLFPLLLAMSAGGLAFLMPYVAPRFAPLWARFAPTFAPLGARLRPIVQRFFPSLLAPAPGAAVARV